VAVAAESSLLEDITTGKISSNCGFFKMKVLKDVRAESVEQFVEDSIRKESVLITDKNQAYVNPEKLVDNPINVNSSKKAANGD